MAKQMGAMSLGSQFGQGLGALAGEVVSASDIGVPLTDEPRPILIPRNVAAFGEGLDIPADEVRIYLALREVAHERLFAHVPWLRPRVLGAIEEYARGIHFDADRWTEVMRDVDPQNPAALQEALGSGLFEPEDTPAQRVALARMEALLALVEGWVEAVVVSSSSGRLPSADRLAESMRRRRAAGGPAEHTLANLVGLELRPRRLREAAALWLTVALERGIEGRDALWGHPDLLPASDDFDDPDGFVERSRPEIPE
jgi:putative hydrolase